MYKTNQNKKIVELFANNKNESFSASNIVDKLADSMNRSTIYRQLRSLEEKNYIRKIYNDKTESYEYQLKDDCDNHLHLKCNDCGRVIHLVCKDANVLLSHILNNHGFKVNQSSTTLLGLCQECSK